MEEEQFVRLKKMKKQEEPPNLNVNKFEHMVLVELLMQDHLEPEKKIGCGIQAFQLRFRPMWKTQCIFLIWDDEFVDDFSFWKCTDNILPLPEDMRINSDASLSSGGGKSRKRKGGGVRIGEHNHGRGGKSRN
ncbi:protein EMBRYO DEFECTIVE 514-like [Populus nigra]|uniref:protein EMBRYO DEFECTIVE 514-like n=1 Tax=Populus nigra TaxID=3691 RepID=UPI002B271AD4|nr:protein EMBRYO DEFECTIVE 514-like [Populus nigra]